MSVNLLQNIRKVLRFASTTQYYSAFPIHYRSYAIANKESLPFVSGKSHHQLDPILLNNTISCRATSTSVPKSNEGSLTVKVLLERLDQLYYSHGYLNFNYMNKLLERLEENFATYNQQLSTEQALFFLEGSGLLMPQKSVKDRIKIFSRLWKYLSENGKLSKTHFQVYLKVLKYNRQPLLNMHAFLQQAKTVDVSTESAEFYSDVLETICNQGNINQTTELLTEMRNLGFALTARNFSSLILGRSRNKDLAGCESVLKSMESMGISSSCVTYTLILANLGNNEIEKAHELIKKHLNELSVQQLITILRTSLFNDIGEQNIILLVQGIMRARLEILGQMPEELKALCIELIHNNKLETLVTIVKTLPTPTFKKTESIDQFGEFIFSELFNAKVTSSFIMEMAEMLKDQKKNSRALHIATEMALKRTPESAYLFLKALSLEEPLRPHYFWPMIMYNFRRNGESGVFGTLKKMIELNVICDNETLLQYVLPRLSIILENPIQALKMFDEAGVKMSQVFPAMMRHLLVQHSFQSVIKINELYPTKFNVIELIPVLTQSSIHVQATNRYQLFAKVLSSLSRKNENIKADFIGNLLKDMLSSKTRLKNNLENFQTFINEIQKFGLTLSKDSAENIIGLLGNQVNDPKIMDISKTLRKMSQKNVNSSNDLQNVSSDVTTAIPEIKHLKEMSLNELEFHLIELEAKGMNPRGVLRRLLQMCVRENLLERAVEIKAKCDQLKIQDSPGMLSCTFDLYIKLNNPQQAEYSLKRLKKTFPGFQIDEHKLIDYAALLVNENQYENGLELLKNHAVNSKITGGDYVVKNVWKFLTNVAHYAHRSGSSSKTTDGGNLTRTAFMELLRCRYCRVENVLLGPIVRECLLRNDIKGAINEFMNCCTQYKRTPLQLELLTLLVSLSNSQATDLNQSSIDVAEAQQLLSELTTAIAKIHGTVNMNSALLMAFAKAGTDKQLRRLLINPEFRINQELLLKNCEHLGEEGAVETLLRLARGTRNLNHVVNEQKIYDLLLNNFQLKNNYSAALNLYERLEADDELKISQEFVRQLVNILQTNNIDVPSNIARRAQIM